MTLTSGMAGESIDDFELFYARRALRILKSRLGHQGLLDLLAKDIDKGNAFLRECAQASDGAFAGGTIVLSADGLSSKDFVTWLSKAFADEDVLIAAHPEHWAFSEQPGSGVNVVETIGSHLSSFYMAGWGAEAPAWAAESDAVLPESKFPLKMAADLVLGDGTVIGRVLCQFGDTTTGFDTALTVYVPQTCKEVVEQHLRHFSVEFRNWIVAAAEAHKSPE
ncbi:hypothetical protein [Amycolatopsis sp. NBC_01480]|uniref:hypothetical protein n=1 Tax=Amycolatopsis sp. NBC_01480 TaxID=2903562 RepID=UPI002E2BC17C|nr:hypothetical protein [Amycolatopsis sp. NBC_01480]